MNRIDRANRPRCAATEHPEFTFRKIRPPTKGHLMRRLDIGLNVIEGFLRTDRPTEDDREQLRLGHTLVISAMAIAENAHYRFDQVRQQRTKAYMRRTQEAVSQDNRKR
ncbi:MAG: hypothetical protein UT63_C0019G0005 [Candidatus Gottesmanbacteria bacterium GW2011_GWC2_39_8]|uniref:Four helix bundle protein n=1 Tax=Candidatus Gottesmanbacteria bacterium GW2011_GWC2_39_8 TaxID=1618450 RepID=A0A0G0PZG7_9BACT|nr:MAG: hypothetical protein UT63_C0019G0005 [Candidatus Gottesmanbacteria bacterium GW2011_GWC2_39_8]